MIQRHRRIIVAKNASSDHYSQYMVNLDRFNSSILQELQRDGRISNIELAERIGLSPSACLRRVQELEKSGVISGYRAVINYEALGVGLVAYIAIGLSDHSLPSQQSFEKAMRDCPAVRECHNVTGLVEYLRVPTASRGRRYRRLQVISRRRARVAAAGQLDHHLHGAGFTQERARLTICRTCPKR
jgi:DNA-binding Lrp family transcriptional regulator